MAAQVGECSLYLDYTNEEPETNKLAPWPRVRHWGDTALNSELRLDHLACLLLQTWG